MPGCFTWGQRNAQSRARQVAPKSKSEEKQTELTEIFRGTVSVPPFEALPFCRPFGTRYVYRLSRCINRTGLAEERGIPRQHGLTEAREDIAHAGRH